MKYTTEQEIFWASEFGNEYYARSLATPDSVARRIAQWADMLKHMPAAPKSILELGANVGINIHALQTLLPDSQITAVEINPNAAAQLRTLSVEVMEMSILDYVPKQKYDLVLTCGVLIHINPDMLNKVYEIIYASAGRYVCMSEYYNPTPVEVPYRGHAGKLFKRDFAGEFLDMYPDFALRNYGFVYHRDPVFKLDDVNWFILEK